MAILDRFLQLLEWLEQLREQAVDFLEFVATPAGFAIAACLFSYGSLLDVGCDVPTAAILASAIALTLHCGLNRPKF